MGHSGIFVTLATYTHPGMEDAAEELRRIEEAESTRRAGKARVEGTAHAVIV